LRPSSGSAAPASTSDQARITWPCAQLSPASACGCSLTTPPGSQLAPRHDEGLRVDQHLAQLRVAAVVVLAQQQQAGLRGDGHAHLVVDAVRHSR
jgi:hypothetical protein